VLDGVYLTSADGQLKFIEVPPPSEQALQTLLRAIIAAVMKRLVRQGVLIQEQEGQWYAANDESDDEEVSALRPLQQGSIVYRIAARNRLQAIPAPAAQSSAFRIPAFAQGQGASY
jgi:hypothetical protein